MGRGLHKKLNESVYVLDTQALGERNVVAAYLVAGKETALIDMGYESSADIVSSDLAELGIGSADLDYLLPTHVHLDHSGSCGTLAKKFPNASIRVHPKGEPHLADPSSLWKGAGMLFGDELLQRYGKPEPIDQNRLRIASDDEVISLGRGVILRTVWTPGHASHHLSYEWEGHASFFTGDAVGIYYPAFPFLVPTTPPTSFNLERAVESLKRIQAASPQDFYTPHYGLVEDAPDWVERNIRALLDWKMKIESMRSSALSEQEVSEGLTEEVCMALGRSSGEVPDYLRISIKISVLGFIRYLTRGPSIRV